MRLSWLRTQLGGAPAASAKVDADHQRRAGHPAHRVHPDRYRGRAGAVAAVRQPDHDRRGRSAARRADRRGAPRHRARDRPVPRRLAAATGGADAARQHAGLRSRDAGRRRPGAAPDPGPRGRPGLVARRRDCTDRAARPAGHRGVAVPEAGAGPEPGPAGQASPAPGGGRGHRLCRRCRRTRRPARPGDAGAGNREPVRRRGARAGRDPGRHRGGPVLPAGHRGPAPALCQPRGRVRVPDADPGGRSPSCPGSAAPPSPGRWPGRCQMAGS